MKAKWLASVTVLVLANQAVGREPQIGDSVVVINDRAEVMAKHGTLATVPLGTQFIVKQKSGGWLLGHFEVQGQNVFGWVRPSSVRVTKRKAPQRPVYQFNWHNLLLSRDKLDDEFTLEDFVDDYMKTSRRKVWNQVRNDEFQLERKRLETKELIRKRVAGFDLDRDFTPPPAFSPGSNV